MVTLRIWYGVQPSGRALAGMAAIMTGHHRRIGRLT
jgi:hypothetical protein